MSDTKRPLRLYLPGPVTTDPRTRAAMARDWGVWDLEFRALTSEVRAYLLTLAGGVDTHGCDSMSKVVGFACRAL